VVPTDAETIHQRRWLALGVLCFSLLVIGLDNTILNVALPRLAEELNATNSELQWIVDGYTLVYAGLLLTSGSLGDRFGRKGALTIGLAIFGVGSMVSAFATSTEMLIATRSLMGVGAALIMPGTLSIMTNVFHEPKERARAIGIWAGVASAGIALGPLIGGFLIGHFWWGSVFLVNVPVAIIAILAGHFVLPTSRDPEAKRLDPIGAVLSIAALMTILWAVIEAPTKGWGSTTTLVAFGLGAALLAGFIIWELRCSHPMLELRFFRNRRFTAANVAVTLVFFAMFGSSFLITQELQFVLGYDALKAGLAMLPIALPMLVLGPVSARLVERFGTKVVVTGGLLMVTAGLGLLSRITMSSGYADVCVPMFVLATGMGLAMAPATESIMGSLPRNRAGIGSAMNDTTRQMGGALGVAVIGSVMASVYRPQVTENLAGSGLPAPAVDAISDQLGAVYTVVDKMGLQGAEAANVIDAARSAFLDGFGGAVLVGAAVALVGALVTLVFLPARAVDPDIEPHTPPPGVSADEIALIAAGSADALIALESDDPEAVSASRSEIDPSSSLAD